MNKDKNYICCFGEILWDLFPSGKMLGGAPMNVAAHLQNLGINASLISRVGDDEWGKEMRQVMQEHHYDQSLLQTDAKVCSGIVKVHLKDAENPVYEIVKPVAWDFIALSPALLEAVGAADAFVFGSLAARDEVSRATLLELVEVATFRVFDVNLREPHFSRELIALLLTKADLVKINEDELLYLASWYAMEQADENEIMRYLTETYKLKILLVTKGSQGAKLFDGTDFYQAAGFRVVPVDTVGCGDAFLAGFLKNYLNDSPLQKSLTYACALGALVAQHRGAIPLIAEEKIENLLEKP